jgi:hypothetical protein
VSTTAEVLLGIIAVAVAIMAFVQVGAVVAGLRVARRVERLASDLDATLKPLVANLNAMSAEASKAAALATSQVERLDRVFAELAMRVDATLATAQSIVAGPAKDGMAIVAGVKAAVGAIKGMREATRRRSAARSVTFEEEEESLFIG